MNKNQNLTNVIFSILLFLLAYVVPQPFLPVLIYDYDETNESIQLWNTGIKPATDILIEIIPKNEIEINSVVTSTLQGEMIKDYSENNRVIFFIYHVYSGDRIFLSINGAEKINSEDIDIIVRSNEGSGIEAEDYFLELLKNLQVILLITGIVLGGGIYFTISKFLTPKKHTKE